MLGEIAAPAAVATAVEDENNRQAVNEEGGRERRKQMSRLTRDYRITLRGMRASV